MDTHNKRITKAVQVDGVAYGYVSDEPIKFPPRPLDYGEEDNITDNEVLKAEQKIVGFDRTKQLDLIFGVVDVDYRFKQPPFRYYAFSRQAVADIQVIVKSLCERSTDEKDWVEAERVFLFLNGDEKNWGLGQFIYALLDIDVTCWLAPMQNTLMVKLKRRTQ